MNFLTKIKQGNKRKQTKKAKKEEPCFILSDINRIKYLLETFSPEMVSYINSNNSSKFYLFHKFITHSDIPGFGKSSDKRKPQENLLYYYNNNEMESMTNVSVAKQSNIHVKFEFWDLLGINNKAGKSISEQGVSLKLVNSSLKYFSSEYTKSVFDALGKEYKNKKGNAEKWEFENLNVNIDSSSNFTTIDAHFAAHGFGIKTDTELHKLRHHIFKGDTLILLYEENENYKNLFLLLEKNPRFFYVLGENNQAYSDYKDRVQKNILRKARLGDKQKITEEDLSNQELRAKLQASWRKELVEEAMTLPDTDNQVVCAFTGIGAKYPQLSPLFRASHIKSLSDEKTTFEEKFDLNNGLLLCANADALFDKHLITIGPDKNLIFSFYLDNDNVLKSNLLLQRPVMESLLNEKRMKYLEYHRKVFEELEQKRKSKDYVEQDEECLLD